LTRRRQLSAATARFILDSYAMNTAIDATDDSLRDPVLISLIQQLGMRYALSPKHWEWQVQRVVSANHYLRFRRLRENNVSLRNGGDATKLLAADREMFGFIAGSSSICRMMIEGRLGYYDALMSKVVSLIRDVPHARILDLGSFGGLTTLYLGRVFPQSTIVGVEQFGGAVRIADEFRERTGQTNVSFFAADYGKFRTNDQFDVVVSMQTLPCYCLPFVHSELPEVYLRGKNLLAQAESPNGLIDEVRRPLAAVRAMVVDGGRAIFHERVPDLSRALLLHLLLSQVGLEVVHERMAAWSSVSQQDRRQMSALIAATAVPSPAAFEEAAIIGLHTLAPGRVDLSDLPAGVLLRWEGNEAHAVYHGFPDSRDELLVRGDKNTGARFHCYFGVLMGRWAYVYLTDTADVRTLSVIGVQGVQSLFTGTMNEMEVLAGKGEIILVEPTMEKLVYAVAKRFARY
jgi:SAM-dependent methyltransferase